MAACPGSSPIFSQEVAGCSWGLPQCQDAPCTQQTRGCRQFVSSAKHALSGLQQSALERCGVSQAQQHLGSARCMPEEEESDTQLI